MRDVLAAFGALMCVALAVNAFANGIGLTHVLGFAVYGAIAWVALCR